MKTTNEYGTRSRLVRLICTLLDYPYGYTKKELAKKLGRSEKTITGDFEVLRNGGLELDYDANYRYALQKDKSYQQLKDLLHFTEEEQAFLRNAIQKLAPHSKKGERIAAKLGSIYDYYRLGHPYLRKSYLERINLLEKAKKEQKQVLLKNYFSSNSNTIKDRYLEVFHLSYEEDILHAFDIDKKMLRHFRISRIKRIEITDTDWQYEGHHIVKATDPFRISDNNQVFVHLRLKVGAYNELTERFPTTMQWIRTDASQKDVFDFQCKVNHKFLGLTNFILGYHHQLVEVVEPESLKEHLRERLRDIEEKL